MLLVSFDHQNSTLSSDFYEKPSQNGLCYKNEAFELFSKTNFESS